MRVTASEVLEVLGTGVSLQVVLCIFRIRAALHIYPAGNESGLRWAVGAYPFGGRGRSPREQDLREELSVNIFAMKNCLRGITAICLLICAANVSAAPFDRDDWVADFEQLKAALTTGYPNLEWAAQRGMDLPAHERRARDRLAAANDDTAARTAIERFVAGFGDGHLELTWPQVGAPAGSAPTESPAPLCAQLGYIARPDTSAIARGVPGYQELVAARSGISAGKFESGSLAVGVLRIALFIPDVSLCEHVTQQLNVTAPAACDEGCRRNVEHRTEALFVEIIEAAVREVA